MQAELQAHLDGLIERKIAAGMSPEEARYAARREFGGVAQITERARDERRFVWFEQLVQDLRYATRTLLKSPSFTITAILTLALGIGVNAALFTVFNMIVLRPLPVKDPASLVRIYGADARGDARKVFRVAEYAAYREASRTLSDVFIFGGTDWEFGGVQGVKSAFSGDAGTVSVGIVGDNFFEVLGARFETGRGFSPAECAPGAAPRVVLQHRFWQQQLGADPNVLGATLVLDQRLFTVIGVTAEGFTGLSPDAPAVWAPLGCWSERAEDFGPAGPEEFWLLGRLAPGVTEQQAKAELDAIASHRATIFPGPYAKTAVTFSRGLPLVKIPLTLQSVVFLSPVYLSFAMVLFVACTNVANLLLARGVARQAEVGVRLTLGAGRGRIVRQLLVENLVICLLGAAIGLWAGVMTLRVLQPVILAPFVPEGWLLFLKPTLDLRVLGFTALLTLGTVLFAGLLPAVQTVRAGLYAMTRSDGSFLGARMNSSRLSRFLVVAQVALCVSLLSCAGVLVRNMIAMRNVTPGYDATVVFPVAVRPNELIADRAAAFRQALDLVSSIPGVVAISPIKNVERTRLQLGTSAEARAEDAVVSTFVGVNYFELFDAQLAAGRRFHAAEQHSSSRVVLITESLAQRLWPGADAVGKTVAVTERAWQAEGSPPSETAFRECEVIGVVRDAVAFTRAKDARRLFLPFALDGATGSYLELRTRNGSIGALREIQRAARVQGIELGFSPSRANLTAGQLKPFFGLAGLSAALGTLALVMAAIGIYGLMSFTVSQRTREIGIRMALGATAETVVRHFLWRGARLVAVGLVLGLVGGGLFAVVLGKAFYGFVDAFAPIDFIVVPLFFGAVALLACWLPARKSAKLDPMVALRTE